MNSNYIECPNGGKCGHRKYHIRSESYRQCLSIANGHGNLAQPGAVTAAPPTTSSWNKGKALDMLLNGDSDYYEPPEFFVTDDMKIEEKLIQPYISTGNIDGLIKKEWEREIKSSIKENLTGDVADEMDELSGRSDSELDSLVDAVFDSEKYNIARAIASKQKPRTFVHYYEAPNGLKTRQRVLGKARSKCKVGSDEWFDLLAESYYNDVTSTTAGGPLSKTEEDCQAARKAMDRKDALDCVAEKMGPRTFSCDCAGNSPRAAEIFDRRYSTYYDGSKEWYSAMAEAYLDDIIEEGWNYDRGDGAAMEADRQAIASALKEAFDDNPYIDVPPAINVVWSGSLRDVAPRGHYTRGVSIQSPHIVIVDPRGVGPISKPVQLSGEYRVFIPDEERANEGWASGIRDETPHKLGEIFEQMDHSGPNRPP